MKKTLLILVGIIFIGIAVGYTFFKYEKVREAEKVRSFADQCIRKIKGNGQLIHFYIPSSVDAGKIEQLRDRIAKFPEVKSFQLKSADENLADFKESHKKDPVISQVMNELSKNPLEQKLVVYLIDTSDPHAFIEKIQKESLQIDITFSNINNLFEGQNALIARLEKIRNNTTVTEGDSEVMREFQDCEF